MISVRLYSTLQALSVLGAPALLAGEASVNAVQQQDRNERVLNGTVIDADSGEPVVGAYIVDLKNSSNYVMTDLDGRFKITVSSRKAALTVSMIGYETQNLDVAGVGEITIRLVSDNMLEESVVVGAGTQKRVSITGAISAVDGEVLKLPTSSLTSSLAGKLAGVIQINSSGAPGATSEFYIRGIGTFGGRSTPLILLDDVEISAGDLNRIPPETIKSFTILKDASATAIYGVRGANGVMLVTTKQGTNNSRAKVGVTLETSAVAPMRMPQFVDGATWMELYNEGQLARGAATARYSQEVIDYTRSGQYPYIYPDVDWQKVMFRKGNINERANINIQGGGNRASYYMSLQFNHDTGIVNAPDNYIFNNNLHNYDYIFQNNISYQLTNTTKLDLHMNAQVFQRNGVSESVNSLFGYVQLTNPVMFPAYFPAQEEDNHIRFGNAILTDNRLRTNPYAAMMDDHAETRANTLNISLKLEQDLEMITKGLSAQVLVNFKNYSSTTFKQSKTAYYYRVTSGSWDVANPDVYELDELAVGNDYVTESYDTPGTDNTFYLDGRLNYKRSFGKHNVGSMAMFMMRSMQPATSLPQRNEGLSGRLTYDYDNRYLAEFNFGYNGTERLAKGTRFEFFPAVSLGWVLSNEPYWRGGLKNVLNYLKLRGSYGLIGSDGFGGEHFLYFDSVTINGGGRYQAGPAVGSTTTFSSHAVNGYRVDGARWERVKKLNVGVDMNLFNQLDITAEYFHDLRDRIMLRRASWPLILGYWNATPWGQVGEALNRGFEFSVNWNKAITKDLNASLRANFTYTQNKYLNLDEPDYESIWQTKTGKPLDGYRTEGYIAEGLFTSQEEIDNSPVQMLGSTPRPGDIKYRDINGDGLIDNNDIAMISPYGTRPRIQYGFGANLNWKKWDIGVFFNGSAKRTIYAGNITAFGTNDYNVMQFIADEAWRLENPNPDAKYPRLGITDSDVANNMVNSTYWMHNGNFIRFKTLELGYSFKLGRVYLNCDNLAVWSPFKLWDPELAWNTYPLSRTFTFGIQLSIQ
jgi:TonB-linked outer membrane protein, SusC/RagA family/TonB-dependent outer membrane receptor, SusC/RagA subfamily, signature region